MGKKQEEGYTVITEILWTRIVPAEKELQWKKLCYDIAEKYNLPKGENIALLEKFVAMEPRKFKKKPIEIEALQFTGNNHTEIHDFTGGMMIYKGSNAPLFIKTLEGAMRASPGDWIIKGIQGEFYPCKADIFDETYEMVQ